MSSILVLQGYKKTVKTYGKRSAIGFVYIITQYDPIQQKYVPEIMTYLRSAEYNSLK